MHEVRGQIVFWVHISQEGPWLPGVVSPRGVTPGLGERKQLEPDLLLLVAGQLREEQEANRKELVPSPTFAL